MDHNSSLAFPKRFVAVGMLHCHSVSQEFEEFWNVRATGWAKYQTLSFQHSLSIERCSYDNQISIAIAPISSTDFS